MSCQDEIKRMTIKMGSGIATVPATSDHRDGTWLDTDIYEGEFYMDIDTGAIYNRDATGITVNGEGIHGKYSTVLTQTGVNAPVVTEFVNTVGAIVVSYSVVGRYLATLTGAFAQDKCKVLIGTPRVAGEQICAYRLNNNVCVIETYDTTGTLSNGILTECAFTIEVFV